MTPPQVSSKVGSNGHSAGSNGYEEMPVSEMPVLETDISKAPESLSPDSGPKRDPYRGVVLVLLVAAIAGLAGALESGLQLCNFVLIEMALTLGLAAGILIGVVWTQAARLRPPKAAAGASGPELEPEASAENPAAPKGIRTRVIARSRDFFTPVRRSIWFRKVEQIGFIRMGTATAWVIAVGFVLQLELYAPVPTPLWAAAVAGLCVVAAGLSATAAHYLGDVDPAQFPESPALCRGARVTAWLLLMTALSIGVSWRGITAFEWTVPRNLLLVMQYAMLAFGAAVCFGLCRLRQPKDQDIRTFPLDIEVLSVFGSRNNILASVLDYAERQMGIDLRSTWALTVVRRSLEPLVLGLLLAGWLSTSLTVVGTQEQGLVERFGVSVGGPPLEPGLHVHFPWPLDRVYRIPVKQMQSLTVGHEGQEEGGPENVLWAKEHAPNEYTLLLGNGRDLITIDASVAYRIADARAWRYHSQNPADALKAIAYRAVMRNTVNRTLADALSENIAELTMRMRTQVQQDADALGLGVRVEAFTFGGMHPPVAVASDYQAVISAELGKTTAIVNAQALRNRSLPASESYVLRSVNRANAEGAEALAKAAGQAWAFRTLESEFRAEPEDYYFRRRIETLEKGLSGRKYTVVDSRFERDGGVLWLTQ